MLRRIVFIAILLLFVQTSTAAFAHVENEKTLYDDIETSRALEDIVYLRGMGLIAAEPGAKLFRPLAPLQKADLAYWAGTFKGFGGDGKQPEQVRAEALRSGLVTSLEGDATYADVNRAYLDGREAADQSDAKLTREQFATYLRSAVQQPAAAGSLVQRLGYVQGPSGTIERVIENIVGEGAAAYASYTIVVGGKEYKLSEHPKALYGPTDLKQWQGKTLSETWMAGEASGRPEMIILKLEQGQFSREAMAVPEGGHGHHGHDAANHSAGALKIPYVPIVAGLAGVLLLLWFWRKSRSSKEVR
ncbi:hypothetical protein ACFFK0_21770 [Paenibacillus chartarius]|uniref:Uncharacterized protein n=1 Tax=Paenibacillus chartarius TaxID=747481 RepID=A0ABV6DQW9_9BACL